MSCLRLLAARRDDAGPPSPGSSPSGGWIDPTPRPLRAISTFDLSRCRVVRSARKGVEGRTKTRKKRRVYLCASAVQALRGQLLARRPTPTGLVFPSPRSDRVWNSDNFRADVFTKAVKRAAQNAGPRRREELARLQFHGLRHTFASLMIAAGANPLQIAEALGHSDKTGRPDATLVWRRYGHLYPGSTREAMAALDRHLEALSG